MGSGVRRCQRWLHRVDASEHVRAVGSGFSALKCPLSRSTKVCGFSGWTWVTKKSPGMRRVVPNSSSAGDALRSYLEAERSPNKTVGSSYCQGICGLHISADFSVLCHLSNISTSVDGTRWCVCVRNQSDLREL